MRRFIFIALYLVPFLLSLKARASKIDKAYEALSVYDYFKAKKLFYAALEKNSAAASFGLATIYYRTDNPFHNYDSAYKFIDICVFSFQLLEAGEKSNLKKFGLNDSSLTDLKDSVCFRSYEQLIRKSKGNNVEMIEQFMLFQRNSPYLPVATNLRDSLVFTSAFLTNTSKAYHEFILAYPESRPVPRAKSLMEKTLFEEQTVSKLPADYESFIKNFPKSPYRDEAENGIFSHYQQKKNIPGLYSFIKKYPKNTNVAMAWKQIYSLSVPEYKPEALSDFLERYPEFPYKENIQQEITLLNLELYSIKENNKFGFIDSSGTPYVLCTFEGVEEFSEGLCAAELNGKFGFIGKTGTASIPFQFEDAESFKNGLAIVQYNGKSCVIDRTGNFIASGYDDISDFNEGLAVVVKGGVQGVISKTGQIVIPLQYDKIGDFSGQVAYVLKNGKYGYIDPQGDLLIANMFEWAETFKNGMARVKFNSKYGVINTRGDFMLKPEYDHIEEPSGNIFVVAKGNHYGFADKTGCLLSELKYLYSSKLKTEDLTDGKWLRLISEDYQNLMELNGKKLAGEEDYEEIYLPESGLIRISTGEKYGFIDEKNKVVIKPVYDDADNFHDNVAAVQKKDQWLLIDKTNKAIFKEKNQGMEYLGNGLFTNRNGSLSGLVNSSGETLLSPAYDTFELVNEYLLKVYKQDKAAWYNYRKKEFVWKESGY